MFLGGGRGWKLTAAVQSLVFKPWVRNGSFSSVPELKEKFSRLAGTGQVTLLRGCPRHPDIAQIVLSNPEKRNALSGPMMAQLHDVVQELALETSLKGVLLRSEQESSSSKAIFCSGGDLETVSSIGTPAQGAEMSTLMHDTLKKFRSLNLVSVCLVNGRAIGKTSKKRKKPVEIFWFKFLCKQYWSFYHATGLSMSYSFQPYQNISSD